ncbi:hypothetical protein CARUB_v10021238mg [Capsella rubella]|uniref:Uncharacterized protein n=1 Tax=Capsella rubella TaxID=81985 RepID=R0ICS6_9BRAS|nr:protein IDA [Capsella rubella]EOA35975.1 hypothetical protein CARUB_v10021238mg [Capsella rubella]
MASCRTMMVLLCLVLFLMASSSLTAAARIGAMREMTIKNGKSLRVIKYSHILGYLPKGVPIPPSAPSKRHNSFVDSLPH